MSVIDDDAGVIEQFTTDAVHPTALSRSESQKNKIRVAQCGGTKATNDAVKHFAVTGDSSAELLLH